MFSPPSPAATFLSRIACGLFAFLAGFVPDGAPEE